MDKEESQQQSNTTHYRAFDVIPPETTALIFLYYLGGLPLCIPPNPADITTPWTLCRVSRAWRDIAMSGPRIWSFVQVEFRADGVPDMVPRLIRYTKFILQLSQDAPLSFQYLDPNTSQIDAHDVITDILSPETHHRIRHLLLSLPFVTMTRLLTSLSALESLRSVGILIKGRAPLGLTFPPLFKCSKNLEIVLIYNVNAGLEVLDTPLTKLTNLILVNTSLPFSNIVRLLPQCPLLAECSLATADKPTSLETLENLTLPYLLSFSFTTKHPIFLQRLFHSLTLPSLESLSVLSTDREYGDDAQNELFSFIRRSGCPLKTLNVYINVGHIGMTTEDSLESLLETIPDLQTLRIPRYDRVSDDVFLRMETGDLVPHLATIECKANSLTAALAFLKRRESPHLSGSALQYRGVTHASISVDLQDEETYLFLRNIESEARIDGRQYVFTGIPSTS